MHLYCMQLQLALTVIPFVLCSRLCHDMGLQGMHICTEKLYSPLTMTDTSDNDLYRMYVDMLRRCYH